jgi:hypothetical protein
VAAHLRGGWGDGPPGETSAAGPINSATAHDSRDRCSRRLGAALRASPTPRERRPPRRTGASLIDLSGWVSSYLDSECLDRLVTSTPYYDLRSPASSDSGLWG